MTVLTNKFVANPTWTISNFFNFPTSDNIASDGVSRFRTALQYTLVANILLESLLTANGRDARNLGEDQLNVFRSIEDSIAAMGVDGRGCLLRLICELQSNPIGEFTVIGEILTVLFTPKRGLNDFLHEYIEAEVAGASGEDCPSKYPSCPFSVMNTVKHYRRFMEGYSTDDDRPGSPESLYTNNFGYQNNHIDIPRVVFQ